MLKLKRIEQGFLFLTLFFLPTQLGKHFWPNFSFVYSLPIDYLSPTIYFWDLLVVLLLTFFLLQGKSINKLALNIFLIFLLTQVISLVPKVLYSNSFLNLGAGLVRAEQYLIAGIFGIYIASINVRQVKSLIFWSLSLAVLGESFLAIGQFITSSTLGLWILGERTFSISTPGIAKFDFYGQQFLRPYATFPHPNVLAAFLILSSLILSLKDFSISSWITKLMVFISGLTVLLTVSRTAILVGMASSLFILKKKGKIMLLVAALILLPILYTRFSTILSFDNLSLVRREQLSEASFEMWSSSKFLGIGLNNFIPISSDQIVVGPSRFLQPVHNIFLLTLSETGLVGFLGLLILITYPSIRLRGQRSFLALWGVIIFLGMFDHYFLTLPQGYRMLFLVWGLSLSVLE